MAGRRRKRRLTKLPELAEAPPPGEPDWKPSVYLRDPQVPLLSAVQWALANLFSLRNPDWFDQRLMELEKVLFPRVQFLLTNGTEAVQMQAANLVVRMREVHTDRERASLEFAQHAIESLSMVELGQLQVRAATQAEGGGDFTELIRGLLPQITEAVAEKLAGRKHPVIEVKA